jgi:hypothetical protein
VLELALERMNRGGALDELIRARAILAASPAFGVMVKVDGAWICPRCTEAERTKEGVPVPLSIVAPNRRMRRRRK